MATVVVQQPDDIPYIGVSEHNPFKSEEDRLSVNEPRPMYFGQTIVHVPTTVIQLASELEERAIVIRFVCTFDTVFSIINFLLSGEFAFLFVAMCNYIGYRGAKLFEKGYIYFYIFFQICNASSKFIFISMKPKTDPGIITVLGLSSFFNLSIAYISYKFIKLFPNS